MKSEKMITCGNLSKTCTGLDDNGLCKMNLKPGCVFQTVIRESYGPAICPECGKEFEMFDIDILDFNFCPECRGMGIFVPTTLEFPERD